VSERICRDCSAWFRCDDDWFLNRGLACPTRCYLCRAARQQQRIDGHIVFVAPDGRFGFIQGADRTRFYFQPSDFGGDQLPITTGIKVSFMPAPGEPTARARRIQVSDAVTTVTDRERNHEL
jgi:hypothetical protein